MQHTHTMSTLMLSSPTTCANESTDYVQCRAMDPSGHCTTSCPPIDLDTVQTIFPESIAAKLSTSVVLVSATSPAFCNVVENVVCADYEANTCCCAPEMEAWQSCLLAREFEFSASIARETPCPVSCGGTNGSGGRSKASADDNTDKVGNMIILVVIVLVVLVIFSEVGIGLYCWVFRKKRKRRSRSAAVDGKYMGVENGGKDDSNNDNNNYTDVEAFKDEIIEDEIQDTPPSSDSDVDIDIDERKNSKTKMNRGNSKDNYYINDTNIEFCSEDERSSKGVFSDIGERYYINDTDIELCSEDERSSEGVFADTGVQYINWKKVDKNVTNSSNVNINTNNTSNQTSNTPRDYNDESTNMKRMYLEGDVVTSPTSSPLPSLPSLTALNASAFHPSRLAHSKDGEAVVAAPERKLRKKKGSSSSRSLTKGGGSGGGGGTSSSSSTRSLKKSGSSRSLTKGSSHKTKTKTNKPTKKERNRNNSNRSDCFIDDDCNDDGVADIDAPKSHRQKLKKNNKNSNKKCGGEVVKDKESSNCNSISNSSNNNNNNNNCPISSLRLQKLMRENDESADTLRWIESNRNATAVGIGGTATTTADASVKVPSKSRVVSRSLKKKKQKKKRSGGENEIEHHDGDDDSISSRELQTLMRENKERADRMKQLEQDMNRSSSRIGQQQAANTNASARRKSNGFEDEHDDDSDGNSIELEPMYPPVENQQQQPKRLESTRNMSSKDLMKLMKDSDLMGYIEEEKAILEQRHHLDKTIRTRTTGAS